MKIIQNKKLQKFVKSNLLTGQSPEGISGRLKNRYVKDIPYLSKNAIYRYLESSYGKKIKAKLEKKKKKIKKRLNPKNRLDGRIFIDKRPKFIDKRLRVGDTEFDFIVSGKDGRGILLVVVDRKLRISFLEPIYQVSIKAVHKALKKIKKRYSEWKTGTTDNDLLFARHKELEQELLIKIFFCHAYHSWEKGTVENTNGEIRKDFPKGSNVSKHPYSFFKKIEKKLNNRFMKCLEYQTPTEVLADYRKINVNK